MKCKQKNCCHYDEDFKNNCSCGDNYKSDGTKKCVGYNYMYRGKGKL